MLTIAFILDESVGIGELLYEYSAEKLMITSGTIRPSFILLLDALIKANG